MHKTIRKCAICLALTAAVATGWAKSADQVSTPAVAAPKRATKAAQHSPASAVMQKALVALDGGVTADTGLKYADDGKRLVSCDPKAVAVTIKKGVRLIYGNAFRGCTNLLRLHFLGDAPNVADEAFAELPRGCTIYVEKERVQESDYYDRYSRRDASARTKMYDLIENDPCNRLDKTFKDVI